MEPVTATRPIYVYLDTSDWSNITAAEAGKREQDVPAVQALRHFAKAGTIQILLSLQHIEEFGGLTLGLDDRLRCVQEFPGTFLFDLCTEEILQRCIDVMVARVEGALPDTPPVTATALSSMTHDRLRQRVDDSRALRRAREMWAQATQLSRKARLHTEDPEQSWHIVTLMRAGDVDAVANVLYPRGTCSSEERIRLQALTEQARLLWSQAVAAGQASPLDVPLVQSFELHVLGRLPMSRRHDSTFLKSLQDEWRRNRPLGWVCKTTVLDSVESNLEQRYSDTASEETDADHAVHVPAVDVFTADKRVAPPLQNLGLPTRVIRSGRLHEVVEQVQALVVERS